MNNLYFKSKVSINSFFSSIEHGKSHSTTYYIVSNITKNLLQLETKKNLIKAHLY